MFTGGGDTIIFTNLDAGAPSNLYEACAGSTIQLEYRNLSKEPDRIDLRDQQGQALVISPLTATNTSGGGSSRYGTITFNIPTNGGSGPIELHRGSGGGSFIVAMPSIIIHNPVVDFFPQTSPLCATDSMINLYGVPSGGIFSSNIQNVLSGSILDATQAGWTTAHDDSTLVDVTYSYTPYYSDGTLCAQGKSSTKNVTIYDNRLTDLAFAPLIKRQNAVNNNRLLTLDSTVNDLITVLEPNIFSGSTPLHPYSFSGTYVTASNVFLADAANPTNTVTLEYNNNGCIGSIDAIIDVYEPLQIGGLPDSLCKEASPISFFRDPTIAYNFNTVFRFPYFEDIEENKVIGVNTLDPNHQSSISVINTIGGAEEFSIDPTILPVGTQMVVLSMLYRNSVTTYTILGPSVRADTFQAIDTLIITPRPSVSIAGVQSAYCADGSVDTLRGVPAFEYRSRTYFDLVGADSAGVYNLPASLSQDSILDPRAVYNALVPRSNRDLPMQLTYTINKHGCVDATTASFTIRAPLNPSFFPKGAYCRNENPSLLQRNVLTSGVQEYWLPATGLDTVTGSFDPVLAGAGEHPITYILRDQFGCSYSYTDTLIVRNPPRIEMTLDGFRNRTTFCANPVFIDIRSTLITGTIIDSIEYFGAGVIDSTLNPNSVFAGGGGTSIIWAEATDTSGCKAYDTLRITIIQAPTIDIDGAFNRVQSNYGPGNVYRAEHTYCKSDPIFTVDGNPTFLDTTANITRGVLTGAGVQLLGNKYYYDPGQVNDTLEVDTVRYTYTDSIGCVNTEMAIVKLDSVPIVSLNGFTNTQFCSNDANVQLQGIPDPNVSQGTYNYRGAGVNPNTGLFTPATAGTGNKTIIYQFIDSKGCQDADTVSILVNAPTKAQFTGYQYQYCASDTVRIWSQNDTLNGSYYFYGNIIIDSVGILSGTNATTGPQNVYYAYIDSNNCKDVDSVNIFIHGTPNIGIYGLDSVYCYNDPIDRITVVPAGTGGGFLSSDTSFSIGTNTILMNPSLGNPGIKTFEYGYRDNNGCENSIVARTYVYAPTIPTVNNLDSFQCEIKDTIPITGNPAWGIFSGPGTVAYGNGWGFVPSKAGVGIHTVVYSVPDTLTTYILGNGQVANHVCAAENIMSINVRPLPSARFLYPTNNTRFCSNDSMVVLQPDPNNPVWDNFRDTSGGVSYTVDSIYVPVGGGLFDLVADTTYYFDPGLVVPGLHLITYIATDSISQCQDSVQFTYVVDDYIPASFTLDSVYCASNVPELLNATPGGGFFYRNGTLLNPTGNSPFFTFDPTNPNVVMDTVVYTISYGACEDTVVKIVQTNPLPQLNFTTVNAPHNTYCLGDAPVTLVTSNIGGSFDGSPGVLAGSPIFYPDLAGAGAHTITMEYTDSSTSCSNTFSDILYVYGRPNLDFAVDGGCQYDSILFKPNNAILSLNNTDQNRVVDSITSVQWVFSPSFSTIGTYRSNQIDSNIIDTIGYVYNTAGIYYTQLIVANRVHCVDTQTVRLVISPTINSYPYVQDFESGDGDWFAESRDSSYALLWEHGIDGDPRGIPDDASNHIWTTYLNSSYGAGEDAWVYSPCFDLDSLDRPMISLDYWTDTRSSVDGAVIEYQRADGIWAPIGGTWNTARNGAGGINWYNTPFISGQPGDQIAANLLGTGWTAPLGWSGKSFDWKNGRYKLDDFRGPDNVLRLRIAFASPAIMPNDFYDGFAFDNVVVRDRTRNVLLETMANDGYTSMEYINNRTYQLIHHTALNKDVTLLQYHIESPSTTDFFYNHNPSLGRNRAYEYNGAPAGRAFIDGDDSISTYSTLSLEAVDFEQDMLETPKFMVEINSFVHYNTTNTFDVSATITAKEDLPLADYRIYVVISEDSVSYPLGSTYLSQLHAVARENDQFHLDPSVNTANLFRQNWTQNEVKYINFTWDHSNYSFINYTPHNQRFQAVVFIQNTNTKEIFQVATTRDVSGYWVGVNPVEAEPQWNEIQGVNLFPNPAHDYFNLKFDQTLENDYQWKLVNIQGVEVKQGTVQAGNNQVLVDDLNCPSGTYILVLYNDKVFVNRKVVLGRP